MPQLNKLLVTSLLFVFVGCAIPEDDLKIPVEVVYNLDFSRQSSVDEKFILSGGYFVFASFEFDGTRAEGDDVYFEKEYENGLQVEFKPDNSIDELKFQIPQGTYQNIRISFNSYDDTDLNSMQLTGSYKTDNSAVYPFLFELFSSEYFEALAEDISGNNQILVSEGAPIDVKILFDPILWFEYLPPGAMDNADLTDINGVETIILNENINSELYDLIEERIHEGLKIVVS